ncbi:MAG: methyltransferase domain-containing protein [Flavobacterium sp.]|uniref:class I SAM-dependent methyltransferase n=1 Tax=Flavobacterium sp. TaxID=239 RepID=UPI0032658AC3
MSRLTTKDYWENYYFKSTTKKCQIQQIVSDYDKYWDILVNNNAFPPKNILEIGGYPGRYLAYLGDKYNLVPSSLDFNSDTKKIEEVMKTFDVKDFQIIQADIFEHVPTEKYDIVISIGFIEHFENFDTVLDKHVNYLKDGATLLVMVPNKRWFRKWYGYLVDYKNLKAHNLKSMKKSVFLDFGKRNNLELLNLEYFGEFQYSLHHDPNLIQKIIYKLAKKIFKKINPYIKSHPTKYFSSVLIGVYKK